MDTPTPVSVPAPPTRTWGEWASSLNPFKSSTPATTTAPPMGGRKRRATGKSKGKKTRRATRRSGRKSNRS